MHVHLTGLFPCWEGEACMQHSECALMSQIGTPSCNECLWTSRTVQYMALEQRP